MLLVSVWLLVHPEDLREMLQAVKKLWRGQPWAHVSSLWEGPPAGLCLLSRVLAQVRAVRALPTCDSPLWLFPAKARALSAAAPTERRLSLTVRATHQIPNPQVSFCAHGE